MATPGNSRKHKCFTLWLDIPSSECPPNHYRLLGLPLFEQDCGKIRAAANQVLTKVATHNRPEDAADVAALRSYIAKVATGLLNPQQKTLYDGELRTRLASAPAVEQVPQAIPLTPLGQHPHAGAPVAPSTRDEWNRSTVVDPYVEMVEVKPSPPRYAQNAVPTALGAPVPATTLRIWPWVAGIATVNTLVLGGIVIWLLVRSTPSAQPVPQPSNASAAGAGLNQSATANAPTSAPAPPPSAQPNIDTASTDRPADTIEGSTEKRPTPREDTPSDGALARADSGSSGDSKITNRKPRKAKVDAPPSDPFSNILNELDLPDVPATIGETSESVSAGRLHSSVIKDLSMELDTSAVDLKSVTQFRIQQQRAEKGKLSRVWQIFATSTDVDEAVLATAALSGTLIASFIIDQDANLRFQWQVDDTFSDASQLCNSVLVLKAGKHSKEVFLRQAINTKRAVFDFNEGVLRIPLELSDLPTSKTLAVAFKELGGVKGVELMAAEDLTLEKPIEVSIGQERRIRLLSELEPEGESGRMELVLRPKYLKDTRGKEARILKVKDFNQELGRQLKAIQRGAGAFQTALRELPAVRAQIIECQARLNNLNQSDVGNHAEIRQLQNAREKLGRLEIKLTGSIRRYSNSLPESYEALSRLMTIGRLAAQLQQYGELEYHLLSRTGSRELVLLRGNGEPPPHVARAEFEIPKNPNVEGTWIDCKGAALYVLNPDRSFQVMSMDNPRPDHMGRWTRQGDAVQLSAAGGLSANYTFLGDIELKGDTHSLWRGL
jgi:hypothetical protein